MISAMTAVFMRDWRLAFGKRGGIIPIVGFFCLALLLFPLALGPEPKLLANIASGMVWVIGALAVTLSLEGIFSDDFRDGSLDQLFLSVAPLPLLVFAKIAAHGAAGLLALLAIAPIFALIFGMGGASVAVMEITLFLGLPSLYLIGAMGAALAIGSQSRTGGLIALMVVPLMIPILIFAVGAIEAVALELPIAPHLLLLSAILVVALPLCPIVIAYCLRDSLND